MSRLEAFTATWSAEVHDEAMLADALDRFVTAARREGPRVAASDEDFVAFVGGRLDPTGDPAEMLGQLQAGDLLGVFGCLRQDASAVAWFRELVLAALRKAMAGSDSDAAEDLFQVLFCRVFLPGDAGQPPKVAAYDGRREFGPWARTLARNAAVDQLRRTPAMTPLEHDHVERVGAMLDDQETSYLRQTCWAEFKAALADAFAGLEPRQRNVLRCHLQGLTAEKIGRMYRVHRVTVARWLSAIRFELLEATRAGLRDRLAGDDRAIDSIFRMVDLDLTASLTRLVGADE
jgi:RNA polymerase sigma-70 factor, ECF subfamily